MGNNDVISEKEIKYNRVRRAGYIACSVIFGVTLSVLCVFLATYMIAFNRPLYHYSMVREEAEFFNSRGFTQEELDYVMDDVLKYLLDGRETLDTQLDGYDGELFTETEISHMVDVKAIFTGIKWITIACAVLAPLTLAGVMLLDRERYKKRHRRMFIATLIGNGIFIGVVVLLMLINFQDTFILFHEILFDNPNWWLNSSDLLIEMQSGNHFMLVGMLISAAYVTLLLAFCLAGIFQKRIGAFFKKIFKKRNQQTLSDD